MASNKNRGDLVEKLQRVIKSCSRVKLSKIADVLGMTESELFALVLEIGEDSKIRIDDGYLSFDGYTPSSGNIDKRVENLNVSKT